MKLKLCALTLSSTAMLFSAGMAGGASTAADSTKAGAAGTGAKTGNVVQVTPEYSKSMEALLKAAQDLRESVQAMAQLESGEKREKAIEEAKSALIETQRAMLEIPPEQRTTGARRTSHEDAVRQLMQASDRLRTSIQAMSKQPPGRSRERAMEQARDALSDTQQALVAVPRTGMATTGAGTGTTGSSAGAADMKSDEKKADDMKMDEKKTEKQ